MFVGYHIILVRFWSILSGPRRPTRSKAPWWRSWQLAHRHSHKTRPWSIGFLGRSNPAPHPPHQEKVYVQTNICHVYMYIYIYIHSISHTTCRIIYHHVCKSYVYSICVRLLMYWEFTFCGCGTGHQLRKAHPHILASGVALFCRNQRRKVPQNAPF